MVIPEMDETTVLEVFINYIVSEPCFYVSGFMSAALLFREGSAAKKKKNIKKMKVISKLKHGHFCSNIYGG